MSKLILVVFGAGILTVLATWRLLSGERSAGVTVVATEAPPRAARAVPGVAELAPVPTPAEVSGTASAPESVLAEPEDERVALGPERERAVHESVVPLMDVPFRPKVATNVILDTQALQGKVQTFLTVRELSGRFQLSGSEWVVYAQSSSALPDGIHATHHDNGEKAAEGEYRNGKRVGLWAEWHANGERLSEGRYWHGEKQGLWTEWHPNGERKTVGEYLYDRREGAWTEFLDTGERASTATYRGGDLEGTQQTFYPGGVRASDVFYEDGLAEGRATTWHRNGEIESRGSYHYGKRVGRWRFYDEDGQLDEERSGDYEGGERRPE